MNDRQESRARWATAAAGWEAAAAEMRKVTMPVSTWMVEAIAPQPGHTVLELAAGPGDTGFLAAELIRPGGTLITSDHAPEMLSAAQRRAEQLDLLDDVRFRQIDAEQPIDLEAASIDGVLCRWGLMLLHDPESALREVRRILRPGGRLALAAWADPEDNPFIAMPARILVERGLLEPPDPSEPSPFSWAAESISGTRSELISVPPGWMSSAARKPVSPGPAASSMIVWPGWGAIASTSHVETGIVAWRSSSA